MDTDSLTIKTLKKLGFRALSRRPPTSNGPDLYVIKKERAYTVEVKPTRKTRRGSIQVPPVEKARRKDDLIAIVLPSGYVLIEPMQDHLKSCTPKGYRTLTTLG